MLPVEPSLLLIQFCIYFFRSRRFQLLWSCLLNDAFFMSMTKNAALWVFFSPAFFVQNLTVLHTKKKRAHAIFAPRGNDFVTRRIKKNGGKKGKSLFWALQEVPKPWATGRGQRESWITAKNIMQLSGRLYRLQINLLAFGDRAVITVRSQAVTLVSPSSSHLEQDR